MASKNETMEPVVSMNLMNKFQQTSQLSGGSGEYLDLLYEKYLESPDNVDSSWRTYFDGLSQEDKAQKNDIPHQPIKDYFIKLAKTKAVAVTQSQFIGSIESKDIVHFHKQDFVNKLIVAYRRFGHCHANLDPLSLTPKEAMPILDLDYYGLSNADLDVEFMAEGIVKGNSAKLRDILAALKNIYCNHIGYQYQYITDHDELIWLQEYIESNQVKSTGNFGFSAEIKKNILQQLTAAEGLERYLGTKYVGQKRFSLEGGESLLVIMDELLQRAGAKGFKEVVIAMAHRGRLNVLVNTLGKPPAELFAEFEGKKKATTYEMSGDVKYHQGFSADLKTSGGDVHVALAFNPSHLEIVSPVAQGSVKARQDRRKDNDKKEAFLISIHGDSAFAGQGVVMETMNMSQLRGFSIGGTVHIVINNQVGFTTSDVRDTRSTRYCTDIAKMIEAPVFHVNGDDPEAVLWVTQLALDYKAKFKKDVVIDLVCYRRHGHNEADEPSATQPVMYQAIKKLMTTREQYAKNLVAQNIITAKQDQDFVELYRNQLDKGDVVVAHVADGHRAESTAWAPFIANIANKNDDIKSFDTSFDQKKLISLGEKLVEMPEDFVLQPQVKRIIEARQKMMKAEQPIDWGCAELLAYASLLDEGYGLRLCGQDSGRGTFAHRHAVLHDQKTDGTYCPLQSISNEKTNCVVIDSILSEEAVLAFEYGYSTNDPKTLVIWEAQFGDFVNGAQVVIDQFMSSCEQKWGRLSGLVLLLPHGYEGMGPEHSSARLERFLQLCAEHNMQVCTPTTPSQVFHMLRRQMLRDRRKPLVVMSPKGFLRHKLAVSSLEDLANGGFELILPDSSQNIVTDKVTRVVLCGGKVYYDLLEARDDEKNNISDVALVRIEQLYPFPEQQLKDLLAQYKNAREVVWCQEEPKNQGAWYCSAHNITNCLSSWQSLRYVGRDSFSAPAAGSHKLHTEQQTKLVQQALNLIK